MKKDERDEFTKVSAYTNTMKSVLEIKNGCHVDSRQNNLLASFLGFRYQLY